MNISDKFYCHEDDNMQSILLNYKEDNMKALIILPTNEYDLNKYMQNFSIQDYNNILNNITEEKISLYLPKFEVNFDCELTNVLMKLGMKKAFTNNADFSNLVNDNDIKIDKVLHKAYIKIDEKGTKACAATQVVTKRKTCLKSSCMDVDHPFLFIIRNGDLPNGHDILFIAKIEDLKSNINENTIKNSDINKAESQQTSNNNNNINLLDFDFPNNANSNSNNINDDINLLDGIFKNNANNNNNNNEMFNFTNQSQYNNNMQINNNNHKNNCYNMNISHQVSNFNVEQVNKNVEMLKQDKKSNDPFDFINDLMKKSK